MGNVKHVGARVSRVANGNVHVDGLRLMAGYVGDDYNQIVISSHNTNTDYILHLSSGGGQTPDGEALYLVIPQIKKWLETQGLESAADLMVTRPFSENQAQKHIGGYVIRTLSGDVHFSNLRFLEGYLGHDYSASTFRSPKTNIEYVIHLSSERGIDGETRYLALEYVTKWILERETAGTSKTGELHT
jgi:hypothetical protein